MDKLLSQDGKPIIEKLQQGIQYYKVVKLSPDATRDQVTKLNKKWNNSSVEVSPMQKEKIILPLVEQLSLGPEQVFTLAELYFNENQNKFVYLHSLE